MLSRKVDIMNIIDVTASIPKSNYSEDRIKPKGIVYHITTDTERYQALNWFRNPASRVSPHYIITSNGDVFFCVDPNTKAYHAGVKKSPTAAIIKESYISNPNEFMIGIEVVANGDDITNAQFETLKELTVKLCDEYNIGIDRYHLIGHNESNSIDKYFDPISSYSVNEIIRGIEADIIIEKLQEKIKRSGKIINKVRKYNKFIMDYYRKLFKKRG